MTGKMAGSPWSTATVAVVTGANKGVGLDIVRQLAEHGLTVVLTARDKTRGETALDGLKAKGLQAVFFHPLDVRSCDSVAALAAWLKEKFGGIDIIVNNAGYRARTFSYESAEEVVATNYRGPKNVTQGLLPLLRASPAGARIVNVTSQLGLYETLPSESVKRVFRDEAHYNEEMVEILAAKYLADVKAGRSAEEGWIPGDVGDKVPMYSESKMFLNAYAAVLAKALAESQPEGHRIFVASFCPGAVQTDMLAVALESGLQVPEGFQARAVSEGADTGVWLALLSAQELTARTGKLFRDRQEYSFGQMCPQF